MARIEKLYQMAVLNIVPHSNMQLHVFVAGQVDSTRCKTGNIDENLQLVATSLGLSYFVFCRLYNERNECENMGYQPVTLHHILSDMPPFKNDVCSSPRSMPMI